MSAHRNDDTLRDRIRTHFECAVCGRCCKGEGLVRIGLDEADRIARFLNLTRRRFLTEHTVQLDRTTWLIRDRLVDDAQAPGGRERWCSFLERLRGGRLGCRINAVKPDQCATFPAEWRNRDSWRECVGLRQIRNQRTHEDTEKLGPG